MLIHLCSCIMTCMTHALDHGVHKTYWEWHCFAYSYNLPRNWDKIGVQYDFGPTLQLELLKEEGVFSKLLKEAWNYSKCLGMLKDSEFLSLELRGQPSSWRTTPHHNPSSTKFYTFNNAVKQVLFLWQLSNPDLSIRFTDREVRFITQSWS